MDGFLPTFTRRACAPPDCREQTLGRQSTALPSPEQVLLPLQDTPEQPCAAFVRAGDRVRAGQPVGRIGTETDGIQVHASVAGAVAAVGPALHPLGDQVETVTVVADGSCAAVPPLPWSTAGSSTFEGFLRAMGISLDYRLLHEPAALFVNATEFEPYAASGARLLLEQPDTFLRGVSLLLQGTGCPQAMVAVEKKMLRQAPALRKLRRAEAGIRLVELDCPCPETVREVLGQQARASAAGSGTISPGRRILMLDPACVLAVQQACDRGMPFIDQLVTVAGSGIPEPGNVWVKTGTPLRSLLARAGADVHSLGRVSLGGPLMGLPQHSLDVPVLRRTRSVFAAVALLFDEDRKSRFYKRNTCVRCAKCVDVCPAGIPPGLIVELVENRRLAAAERLGLFSCLECGLCCYVCPSIIPLVDFIKLGKLRLAGPDGLLSVRACKTLCC
jgi:electron transport complex protein RnfC